MNIKLRIEVESEVLFDGDVSFATVTLLEDPDGKETDSFIVGVTSDLGAAHAYRSLTTVQEEMAKNMPEILDIIAMPEFQSPHTIVENMDEIIDRVERRLN